MESRQVKIIFVAVLFSIFPLSASAFDQGTTHPGLTQEIISFYNEKNTNNITQSGAQRLIDGSILEDEPGWRSTNHFYDPVRNIGVNNNTRAIDWATDGGGVYHNNYTWGDAISAYADGDMNTFYFTLGHVLHLVEDMGVPEHTRNDQHINGSPFETWAKDNKNRTTLVSLGRKLADKSESKKFEDVVGAMKYLAKYSNNNFYSQDTINNPVFKYPNPVLSEKLGGYVYDLDNIINDKHKVLVIDMDLNGNENFVVRTKDDTSVLADYFDRLSSQIIPVGAGVIELAVEQGEKLKTERAIEKEKRLKEAKEKSDELTRQYEDIQKSAFFIRYPMRVAFAFENHIWNPTTEFISKSAKSTGNGIALVTERSATSIFDAEKASIFTGKTFATISAIFVKEKATEVKQATVTFVQKANDFVAPLSRYATTGLPPNTPPLFSTKPAVVYVAPPDPIVSNVVLPTTPATPTSPPIALAPMMFIAGSSGAPPPPPTPAPTPAPEPTPVAIEVATTTSPEPATTTPEIVPETPPADPPQITFDIRECASSLTPSICLLPTGILHGQITSNATSGSEFAISVDDAPLATSTEKNISLNLTQGKHSIVAFARDASTGQSASTSPFVIEYNERPLAISEVNWGGTDDDFNGEWIELHNTTEYPIDLTNFKLRGFNDGTPDIQLSGSIAGNAYYLIENQTDATVPAVLADLVVDFGGLGFGNTLSYAEPSKKIYKGKLAINKLQKAPMGRLVPFIFVDTSSLQDYGEHLVLTFNATGTPSIIIDETPLRATCGFWCFGSRDFNNHTTMARKDFTMSGLDQNAWVENVFEPADVEAQMDTLGAKFFGSPRGGEILVRL